MFVSVMILGVSACDGPWSVEHLFVFVKVQVQ